MAEALHTGPTMSTLRQDLWIAARSLRRNPVVAFAAILTIALAVGLNTAIFSIVHAVLIRPLPYPDADRIVRVLPESPMSVELFDHLQESSTRLEAVALVTPRPVALTGTHVPREIPGASVTPRYFDVLGVEPFLGPGLPRTSAGPGDERIAVVSYGFWQRELGARTDAIGTRIDLDGAPTRIVGVMPESFAPFHDGTELWLPLTVDRSDEAYWDWIGFAAIGRLRSGATVDQASAELRASIRSYGTMRPGYFAETADRASVVPLQTHLTGDFRRSLSMLLGAVALVLLIACANVSNLLLARLASRKRDLAVRSALGAGLRELARNVVAESLILAFLGGVISAAVAKFSLGVLVGRLPSSMPRTAEIAIDRPAMVFALMLTMVAGLLVALVPTIRASRIDPNEALRASSRSVAPAKAWTSQALIAAQMAIAIVLVASAALLARSFARLNRVDVGFDPRGLLTMRVSAPDGLADGDERARFFERVRDAAAATPGVESASMINRPPMTPGDVGLRFSLAGRELPPDLHSVSVRLVSPDFLATLRMPLRAGRPIRASDREGTAPVGLINATLARRLFGDDDPIGQTFVFETGETWFTVIGVVGDIKQHTLDAATAPQVYRPLSQTAWEPVMSLVVRSARDGESLLPAIQEAVARVAPGTPVSRAATMDSLIRRSTRSQQLMVSLFSIFGLIALALGIVGVFGVTSHVVGLKRHESGIRLALGASAANVTWQAMLSAIAPVATGLTIGGVGVLYLTRFLQDYLFEVTARDPLTLGAVAFVLLAAAAVAAWLPSRRAAQVDPMIVLRAD